MTTLLILVALIPINAQARECSVQSDCARGEYCQPAWMDRGFCVSIEFPKIPSKDRSASHPKTSSPFTAAGEHPLSYERARKHAVLNAMQICARSNIHHLPKRISEYREGRVTRTICDPQYRMNCQPTPIFVSVARFTCYDGKGW